MKILFLTSDFPSPWDNARGAFNLALARAISQQHDVRVIAPVPWPKRVLTTAAPMREEFAIAHPTYLYPPKIARQKYDSFYWMSVRGTARRTVSEFQPDIVLSYWAHPDGAAAVRIAKECGAASAIIVGGSDVLLITRDPARRAAVVDALSGADAVITVSRHLRDATIALGIDESKVHVWSQGVDRDVFYPDESARSGTPSILWVGRMEPVKGLDVLLDAMPLVRETIPDAQLNLIGEGSMRREIVRRRRGLKLDGAIHLIGHVEPAALGAWYRAATVTVLPSRSEGLPNVLRESLACGTPFVASNVGGISEIARPGIDRLIKPESPRALADALVKSICEKNRSPMLADELPTWEESADALVKRLRSYVRAVSAAQETQSDELVPSSQL